MPIYEFRDENGDHEDVFMTLSELEKRLFKIEGQVGEFIVHNGKTMQRIFTSFGGQISSCWPLRSKAAGVAVEQIKEQSNYDRSVGIPTEYCSKTGDAIYTDANHRKKHLKHHGLIDKSSFC